MKNYGNYTYFVYFGNNPKFSFRNYVDPETGLERGYVVGYDKTGNPIFKEWFFDALTRRQIRVGNLEEDLKGQKAIDFLKHSPEFYDSGTGGAKPGTDDFPTFYKFREANDEKTAQEAVDTRAIVITSQAKALELKGQTLRDIAAVIGVFSKSDSVLKHRVLDFAGNFPEKFVALVDDPTLKVRSILKKAINDGVFKVSGRIISWEGRTVGADEEEAISALLKDEGLLKAVKLNLQKFGSAE